MPSKAMATTSGWIGKISLATEDLKQKVRFELENKKVAVMCIGVGDLRRCSDEHDFFRWEIDCVRQLEEQGKLRVAIVAHGTGNCEDLICGTSNNTKIRKAMSDSLGEWGKDLLKYLSTH
jgi:hypothetical protein